MIENAGTLQSQAVRTPSKKWNRIFEMIRLILEGLVLSALGRRLSKRLLGEGEMVKQESPSKESEVPKFEELDSTRQFQMIADHLPQIVWIQKSGAKPSYYNRQWFEYTGQRPPASMDEVNWGDWVHPDDLQVCKERWEKAQAHQTSMIVECRIKNRSGHYRWHLVRCSPVPFSKDLEVLWIGTSTDIHALKILNEKIKSSEEYLRFATSAGQIGTWTMDVNTQEVQCSPINAELFGLDRRQGPLTLNDFLSITVPEDVENVRRALDRVVKERKEYFVEYRIVRWRQGRPEIRWIHSRGDFIEKSYNSPLAYGISYDITERKKSEERSRCEAEAARAADRLKTEFLANMSHEIRTPLSSIIGYADLLQTGSFSDREKEEFFKIIQKNGKLLLQLISDILDLSKVESGQLDVEKLEIRTDEFIHEVVTSHEFLAAQKNIELRVEIDKNVPNQIWTDPVRARQILVNLLSNAIKFTSQGFVLVHAIVDEDSGQIRIQIQDTGIGIVDHQRDKLFHAFTQADSSTTRKYGGTGLGLALSRKLATALGGDLNLLSSEIGVGSIFELRLPLEFPEDQAVRREHQLYSTSDKNEDLRIH
jgi:PAS domain S-box-containing protein